MNEPSHSDFSTFELSPISLKPVYYDSIETDVYVQYSMGMFCVDCMCVYHQMLQGFLPEESPPQHRPLM